MILEEGSQSQECDSWRRLILARKTTFGIPNYNSSHSMPACFQGAQDHEAGMGRSSVGAFRWRLFLLHLLPSFDSSGSKMGSRAPVFPPLGVPLSSPWVCSWTSRGPLLKQTLVWTLHPQRSSNCVKLKVTSVWESGLCQASENVCYFSPWSNESLWALRNQRETAQGILRTKIYSEAIYFLFQDRALVGNFEINSSC